MSAAAIGERGSLRENSRQGVTTWRRTSHRPSKRSKPRTALGRRARLRPNGIGGRYPGQYFDAETGLHYNWHRYYAPELGRYLQPDSLQSPVLDPLFLTYPMNPPRLGEIHEYRAKMPTDVPNHSNGYPYVSNDPIDQSDPEGLGILNCVKCGWYGKKIAEAGDQCRQEFNSCNGNPEKEAEFGFKYGSNYISVALENCACQRAGEEICAKWLANCAACAWSPPPPGAVEK